MFSRHLASLVATAIAIGASTRAHAQGVVGYECDTLPVNAGFALLQSFCNPGESLQQGLLLHEVGLCPGFDPPVGQQIDYGISLEAYTATSKFFVEWRAETTGDRSEIPYVAPAALVAGSFGPVNYHVTFARDQVRLIRDNLLPIIYTDTVPGIAHTYRLEMIGTKSYAWYVDGTFVDGGIPEGAYPSFTPQLNIRAKAKFGHSTTRWDYIRYGTIPADGSGDFDSNGAVDTSDVYFLLDCLLGPDSAGPGCRWADMNHDGVANAADIQQFVAALAQ